MTHGVEVQIVGETNVVGVAQTSSGTLLILENALGPYVVYYPVKPKFTHIHIPLRYLELTEKSVKFNVEVVNDVKGVKQVLTDVLTCVQTANCYLDMEKGELLSMMPMIPWLNKRRYEECMQKYNDDVCLMHLGAPIRMLSFMPFGVGPFKSRK